MLCAVVTLERWKSPSATLFMKSNCTEVKLNWIPQPAYWKMICNLQAIKSLAVNKNLFSYHSSLEQELSEDENENKQPGIRGSYTKKITFHAKTNIQMKFLRLCLHERRERKIRGCDFQLGKCEKSHPSASLHKLRREKKNKHISGVLKSRSNHWFHIFLHIWLWLFEGKEARNINCWKW